MKISIKALFLFVLINMLFCPSWAMAAISVHPYHIDFYAKSPKRVKSLRVINTSAKTQTYRVSFVNFKQDNQGNLVPVQENDNNDFYADKYLHVSPRQFTLKPHEAQVINVARKSLARAKDGEYVSHLKISEVLLAEPEKSKEKETDDQSFSMKLHALFAVTVPVTVLKGDGFQSKTSLAEYKLINGKDLQLRFKREGTKSSRFNIVVLDKNDRQIGRANGVKIYMSTDYLTINVALSKDVTKQKVRLRIEDTDKNEKIWMEELQL